MTYKISPSYPLATEEVKWAYWDGGFTSEECDKIVAESLKYPGEEGLADYYKEDSEKPHIRPATSTWLPCTDDSLWIYQKVEDYIRLLNGRWFQFDLTEFSQQFRYRTYHAEQWDHYDWHCDWGGVHIAPRKLTFVLQLNDPIEYEGGVLQLMNGKQVINVPRKKGYIALFPVWLPHRVTPITKGTRRTIIAEANGPAFR